MANVNKVMLLGNITRDIEVRYTPKGAAVADLGMAINRIRTGDNGERIEEVTFVDVTLWGRQAELAGQYLSKGRSIFIEGRLDFQQWEKDGQKRSKLRVVGETMQFIGSKDEGSKERAKEDQPPQQPNPAPRDTLPEEDDIPF